MSFNGCNAVKLISEIDKNTTVFVGSGSSYFFIGKAETFLKDIAELDFALMGSPSKKKCTPKARSKPEKVRKPLTERLIVDFFPRFQKDGYAIIIEGNETGGFWTKDEFDYLLKKCDKNYAEMMEKARSHGLEIKTERDSAAFS